MAKDTPPNHYEILGVAPGASLEEISQAYRKLAKQLHPDEGGPAGLFRQIVLARSVLSDPGRRAEYDRQLAGPRHQPAQESTRQAHERAASEREAREREVQAREARQREARERESRLAAEARQRALLARQQARRTTVVTAGVACLALVVFSIVLVSRRDARRELGAGGPAAGSTAGPSDRLTAAFGWSNSDVCQLKADGYHVVGDAGTCLSSIEFTDGDITVDVRTVVGGLAGIAFRVSDTTTYCFQILPTGEWSLQSSGVSAMRPVTPLVSNAAIVTGDGARNTLRVHARGARFEFFANGVKLGEAQDDAYREGTLGLFGYTLMGSPNEIVFSNLRVTDE
ncbi:DnaJ domain-containing protein [Dactylosporangium sp. NPDC049525]|uniref:DnaJ domain-containing protein n=1 Tax=Dactylosporangium sp. NPDC049525 TaxID=3154730 RepID=UPI00342DC247